MKSFKPWFVIINPTSGNGSGKHKWIKIKSLLELEGFEFEFAFTKYENHSIELAQNAINEGVKKIIAVGGDGTLHNIVNGINKQDSVAPSDITVGVIPIGTGNDWIKTYKIPLNIEKAVGIIKMGKTKKQDLGRIEFLDNGYEPVFFNNLAGIGFDGYVVSKVGKYKRLGAFAYLVGAIAGLFSFQNFSAIINLNKNKIETKSLMVLAGICKYSGGGMQLTQEPNPNNGLFDVSIAKNLTKLEIIKNLFNLYNGNIVKHPKVDTYKVSELSIIVTSDDKPFIQADGELIGKGDIRLEVVPNAFSFFVK
jgi:diacylglycerol kinase (ATP)